MLQARFFFKPEKCDDVSGGAIHATVGFPVSGVQAPLLSLQGQR